jgi:hypothetical protein
VPFYTSSNQTEFPAEVIVIVPGLKNIDKPAVTVFPKLLICCDCGFSSFMTPAPELAQLCAADELLVWQNSVNSQQQMAFGMWRCTVSNIGFGVFSRQFDAGESHGWVRYNLLKNIENSVMLVHSTAISGDRYLSLFVGNMNSESHSFDWSLFWLLEVIFTGVPALITVAAFRGGETLSLRRAAILVVVLIGLTVLNLIAGNFTALVDHLRKR